MFRWLKRLWNRLFGRKNVSGPPIQMFVKARRVGNGIDWDLGGNNNPPPGRQRIDVPKGSGERDIVIHLVATQGIDVAFDTNDPVWIEKGTTCPPKSGNNCPDQIDRIRCDRNTLTMHDTNSEECTLIYQMNFVGADAAPCDPEIRNGGTD